MSKADMCFKDALYEITRYGDHDYAYNVRPKWEDGEKAHSFYITQVFNKCDYGYDGVPIQTVRKIAWKSALREILAIYQKRATTREEFESMGITWWESWFNEDGNLGTSYAYQLKKEIEFPEGKMNQVDRVIWLLKNRPMDRRIMTNMFNLEELKDMTLPPCAYSTIWSVRGKKLDMTLIQRSGDAIPAAGFGGINTIQYIFLLAMISRVTGYEIGTFSHYVNNLHIYDRHIEIANKISGAKEYPSPKLWINPDIKDFYDFTDEDIKLIDYKYDLDIKNIPIAV